MQQNLEPLTNPPLSEVSNLILENWGRPCWNYDENLLQSHLQRPEAKNCIKVAFKEVGVKELASYQAYIPFNIEYFGQNLKACFASFLTVSKNYQGLGLAFKQQDYLLKKAIESNYDIYITMCEVGAESNFAVMKAFKKNNIAVHNICTFNYYASLEQIISKIIPKESSSRVKVFSEGHIEESKPILKRLGLGSNLRKVVSKEDLEFLFMTRPLAKTFIFEKGGEVKGLINFLYIEVLEKKSTLKNIYFENIWLEELSLEEKIEFLGNIFKHIKGSYQAAFLPQNGIQDTELFKFFKFREVSRKLNFYMAELKPNIVNGGIRKIDNFFFDVY